MYERFHSLTVLAERKSGSGPYIFSDDGIERMVEKISIMRGRTRTSTAIRAKVSRNLQHVLASGTHTKGPVWTCHL